jgi:hypothetical protein
MARTKRQCITIAGCENPPERGSKWCTPCRSRYFPKPGDPKPPRTKPGRRIHPPATYDAVHERMRSRMGRTMLTRTKRQYTCPCGEPAVDWSYNHGCPDEQRMAPRDLAYCEHFYHYEMLCRRCHLAKDREYRRLTETCST